jgi:UDP-galactose transporter
MASTLVKVAVLGGLSVQTACVNVVLTWSRSPDDNGRLYNIPLAIFLQEILKASFSLIIAAFITYRAGRQQVALSCEDEDNSTELASLLRPSEQAEDVGIETPQKAGAIETIYDTYIETFVLHEILQLSVPALLYVMQSYLFFTAATSLSELLVNLLYLALTVLSNPDATTYAILAQLKILTTALFTVLFLKRSLNLAQWASLACLFLGVALFQTSTINGVKTLEAARLAPMRGLAAILVACCLSGFANVYTERILQKTEKSIFIKNAQMAVCSLLPASISILIDVTRIASKTNLLSALAEIGQAFGIKAWSTIALSVWGGFMVALSIKFTSSIAKGFATTLAIMLTIPFAIVFLHEKVMMAQLAGCLLVTCSIISYTFVSFSQQALPETEDITIVVEK